MKILHVITDSDRRGAQVFAFDLHHELSPRPGVSSAVIALTKGAVGGLDVECLGPARLHWRTLRELRRRMQTADITVAHGSSTLAACALAGLGPGRPFVYRQISDTKFWVNTWQRRVRVRFYMARSLRVIALAPSSAEDLESYLGVSPHKVKIIPNGVPRGTLAPAPVEKTRRLRERYGLDPGKCTLLAIGALVPEKGVDMVIEALRTSTTVQLLVVGDGPERLRLEAHARSVAPDRVVFTGSVNDPSEAYAAADLLVLASRGGDSMPAVIIEAGFCGLPSLSTDVGAIAATISHNETGTVVPPANQGAIDSAIIELCRDNQRRVPMGAAALRYCLERFEIAVVADAWAETLQELVAPSKP